MNNEIKEILGILRRCTYGSEVYLIKEHGATLLLDYITNLQHTKEYLCEVLHEQDLELQDYKSRIEKAVEYIENTPLYETTYDYNMEEELEI